LQSKRAVVVPWFLAKGYFTTQILPREFGETAGVECQVTEPIGSRPEILDLVLGRAEKLCRIKKHQNRDVCVLIASHGTGLHAGSRRAAEDLAVGLSKKGYRSAQAVFLEEEPRIADWRKVVTEDGPVVVLPHFLAGGLHGSEDVPGLLGLSSGAEGWSVVGGREIGYGAALGRPEEMEEMVIRLASAI
jgi:sirohydrochlorin ferrochelatase